MSDKELDDLADSLLCADREQIDEILGSHLGGVDVGRAVKEAEERAGTLLRSPSVFSEFVSDVRKAGLVGEKQNAVALFVAATSRLRPNPLSVLVKGSSSAGKNYLVRMVLKFLPAGSVHEISSMSERSLNFISQSDLRNCVLYFYEIDGRSRSTHPNRLLLSEGKLVHWYTKSEKGSKEAHEEVTGGPVSCISTTTENRLQIDDESRHLSLWLDESATQTKRIASAYATGKTEHLEPARLVAWLRLQKLLQRRKDVPIQLPDWFGRLVELMPTGDVRIRRYWPAFVEACKTVCLIHSFKHDDAKSTMPRELVVHFSDFAVANLIFDNVISRSLTRNAKDEDVQTGELVARIFEEKGRGGVEASDLVGEAGISSIDKAYRLLKRAAHAGTIHRSDVPTKNNEKFYLPLPQQGFLGTPGYVYKRLGIPKPVAFVHPITGVQVRYAPEGKK